MESWAMYSHIIISDARRPLLEIDLPDITLFGSVSSGLQPTWTVQLVGGCQILVQFYSDIIINIRVAFAVKVADKICTLINSGFYRVSRINLSSYCTAWDSARCRSCLARDPVTECPNIRQVRWATWNQSGHMRSRNHCLSMHFAWARNGSLASVIVGVLLRAQFNGDKCLRD